MRPRARAGLAALGVGLAALACGPAPTADELRERVARDLERGELGAARERLAAFDERAESPDDRLLLADLRLRVGEPSQAIAVLEDALERSPDRQDLRLALARVVLTTRDGARARALAAEIPPSSDLYLPALMVRAQALLELGDADAAQAVFAQAEATFPDRPEAKLARASALMNDGKLAEARALIEEARAKADDPEQQRRLELASARLLLSQGDADGALLRMDELAVASPAATDIQAALIEALLRARGVEPALAQLARAREAAPEQPAYDRLEAQIEILRGTPESKAAAETALARYVERSSTPAAYVEAGSLYQQLGSGGRATEVLGEGATRFPESYSLRVAFAEALIDGGSLDAAEQEIGDFAVGSSHEAYLRGRLAFERGDFARAEAQLRVGVSQVDRGYTQYWYGRALQALGRLDDAELRYQLALNKGAGAPAAAALFAMAQEKGRWDMAAEAAAVLARTRPGEPASYGALIVAQLRAGRVDSALQIARELAQRFPDDPDTIARLTMALRTSGELAEAARTLEEAERRIPEPTPALRMERAELAAARGDLARGIQILEALGADAPDSADRHVRLARLYLVSGERERGLAELDAALAIAPDDPGPLGMRVRYLASIGETEAALRDAERYAETRPREAEMQRILGVLYQEAGRARDSIAAYDRSIELDPGDFLARNNLALLLGESGDLERAAKLAAEAYERADSNPEVVDTLGWIYLKQGRVERAIALLERARELDGTLTGPPLHLAEAYREAGRVDEAKAVLASLQRTADDDPSLGAAIDDALRALQ